jgi:hypothetical protein
VKLSVAREFELQKKILECESKLNSSKNFLVEEDIIFFNLEHELTHLNWAILESKSAYKLHTNKVKHVRMKMIDIN